MAYEIWDGTTGIVLQPIYGAQEQGFIGFIKGIGVGIFGFVATPMCSFFIATQSICEGVSGSANWVGDLGKGKLELLDVTKCRVRPRRQADLKGNIKIYNSDLAIIHRLLRFSKKPFLTN